MWYKSGTVSVENGSAAVIGDGTAFLSNVRVGDGIVIEGSQALHEVTNVASEVGITIKPAYDGVSRVGVRFAVVPILGYDKDLSDSFNRIRLQLEGYLGKLDDLNEWVFEPTREAIEAATRAVADADRAEIARVGVEQFAYAASESETNAKASELAAATSETNAKASELAAATSETNAAASAVSVETSETNAKASELAAKESETNAASSASSAVTSETNAALSASSAETSETNAKASELAAKESETNAALSASSAETSETNAASSASSAATSETNAKTSELAAQYYASIIEGATGSVFVMEAGNDIPAGAFVQITDGLAHPATDTITDGFVIKETLSGSPAEVSVLGSMHSSLTGLIPGSDYWLLNGQPSSTPPTSGIIQKIGTAVSASRLLTISSFRISIRP